MITYKYHIQMSSYNHTLLISEYYFDVFAPHDIFCFMHVGCTKLNNLLKLNTLFLIIYFILFWQKKVFKYSHMLQHGSKLQTSVFMTTVIN